MINLLRYAFGSKTFSLKYDFCMAAVIFIYFPLPEPKKSICTQTDFAPEAVTSKPCMFPFNWQNRSYTGCVRKKELNHEPVCPLVVDRNFNPTNTKGIWRKCDNDCPIAGQLFNTGFRASLTKICCNIKSYLLYLVLFSRGLQMALVE